MTVKEALTEKKNSFNNTVVQQTICCCLDVPNSLLFQTRCCSITTLFSSTSKNNTFWACFVFPIFERFVMKNLWFLHIWDKKKIFISIQLTMLYFPSPFKTNSGHLPLDTMTVHAIWQNEGCQVFCSDELSIAKNEP